MIGSLLSWYLPFIPGRRSQSRSFPCLNAFVDLKALDILPYY
jgi:hypothetical protein